MAETDNQAPQQDPRQLLATLLPQMGGMMGGTPPAAQPSAPPQLGAPQGSPLPPTNPIQPQAAQLDPQQVAAQAMQQGMQQTTQQLNRANTLSDQAMRIAMDPYTSPNRQGVPGGPLQYGFQPSFQHITGMGSLFHDIAQALLTVGVATRPGQAVEDAVYGPSIRARQAEMASRASEISAIEKGAQQAEEATGPLAKMGPAYVTAGARETAADAAASRANTAATNAMNRHNDALARLQLESKGLDLKTKQEKFNERFKDAYLDVERARISAGESENQARVNALTDVRSSAEQNKYDQSFIGNAMRSMGLLPEVAVSQQSNVPAAAATPRGGPSGSTIHYKAGGKEYNIPPDKEADFLKAKPGAVKVQ